MASPLLASLRLSNVDALAAAEAAPRTTCLHCNHKMKYYCYNCQRPLIPNTPHLTLPIHLDIVHHPTEKLSKSTAIAARILAPETSTWFEYPANIPAYDPAETILLFPAPNARRLADFPDLAKYKRVVCVESVWSKANGVAAHPHLRDLPKAVISCEETLFWRYQNISDTNLSTIEAIFYFYRDYITCTRGEYRHEVDDLLWFFSHIYNKVQRFYIEHPDKQFTHKEGYIKYDTPRADAPAAAAPAAEGEPPAKEAPKEEATN